MSILSHVKISAKIISLIILLGMLTIAMTLVGSTELRTTSASYSELVEKKLPITTKLSQANRFALQMVYSGYRAMAYDAASEEAQLLPQDEQDAYDTVKQLIDESRKLDPSMGAELDDLMGRVDSLHESTSQAVTLGLAGKKDEAQQVLTEADGRMVSIAGKMAKSNNVRVKESAKLSTDLRETGATISRWLLIVGGVGIALAIALAWVVSHIGITKPIQQLSATMARLASGDNHIDVPGTTRGDEVGDMAKTVLVFRDNAQAQEAAAAEKARDEEIQTMVVETLGSSLQTLAGGDLTVAIDSDFPGRYAALKTNFNEAVNELCAVITAALESTSTIRTGSGEIAAASEDLARRTEANAASLEETAAAVTQMDHRLKATADAATQTVQRADGAIATVSSGRSIADEAVQAMTRVSESAKGIDGVIEGLDKIAFQTRVLAMNAAVEAGRAGDAGRGFAVVADLVSALAMRAEEEAKRARDQLTVTQADIGTAVNAVQRVDGALADISTGVGEVHELLARIATDNQVQSTAITQVSAAIGTMDTTTQQNAAMVEETSAAARNLSAEVATLAEQAGRFRVGRTIEARRSSMMIMPSPLASATAGGTMEVPVSALAHSHASADNWASF